MNGTNPKLLTESTGNDTFDILLGGGIPRRSLTIVAGEPGSGKTIFTLQMLFHAAQAGKRCLYFSTQSEPSVKLIEHMQQFAFFDGAAMDSHLSFIDLGNVLRASQEQQLEAITNKVEATSPAIVAIDGFRSLGDLEPTGRRAMVHDLAVHLSTWGATVILVGEYPKVEGSVHPEFGIADGIIRLGVEHRGLTAVREVEVVKMRGANFVTGKHFCDLGSHGLSIYPRVRAPGPRAVPQHLSDQRSSTGIEGLDDLLGGGLPTLSTTVILGGTGAGKSLTGLHFLLEGARRGEKGVLFCMEETPDQIRSSADHLGLDLAARENEGLMSIQYSSPVELSTDRFLHEATRLVERMGARRAVFDSLTSMSLGVQSDRRFKELVYSIAKHLRGLGVTVVMTMESEQFFGSGKLTGHGVSFLADVLIQMRYVEVDGHLEKAVSVIKARGIHHLTEMRQLTVDAGKGGVRVTKGRYEHMRGILTGVPSPA